jgi:hypothetical protein
MQACSQGMCWHSTHRLCSVSTTPAVCLKVPVPSPTHVLKPTLSLFILPLGCCPAACPLLLSTCRRMAWLLIHNTGELQTVHMDKRQLVQVRACSSTASSTGTQQQYCKHYRHPAAVQCSTVGCISAHQ